MLLFVELLGFLFIDLFFTNKKLFRLKVLITINDV